MANAEKYAIEEETNETGRKSSGLDYSANIQYSVATVSADYTATSDLSHIRPLTSGISDQLGSSYVHVHFNLT